MSIHDVYIYCDESDVAPFVNIIGTADKDNSEDIRYLITQIVELAEIAAIKYLAGFVSHEMGENNQEDIENNKTRVNTILVFMNNTMKYAFLDDFFPEEPPP